MTQLTRSSLALFNFAAFRLFVIALIFITPYSRAQQLAIRLDRPDVQVTDENHVAVSGGKPSFTVEALAIGNEESKLGFSVSYIPEKYGHMIYHNYTAGIRPQQYPTRTDVPSYEVNTGETSEFFYLINGQYVSYGGQGASLTDNGSTFLYVNSRGVEYTFSKSITAQGRATLASLTGVKYPDGIALTYYYQSNGTISSVNNNRGLQLKFIYGAASGPSTQYLLFGLVKVIAINNAVEYCDPLTPSCSLSYSWPEANITSGTLPPMPEHEGNLTTVTITDSAGLVTRFTSDAYSQLVRVKERTSIGDNIIYSYCRNSSPYNCYTSDNTNLTIVSGILLGATNAGRAWSYDFYSQPNTGNYFATSVSSGPLGTKFARTRINGRPGPLLNVADTAGNSVQFEESDRNYAVSSIDAQGRNFAYYYDARGNLTQKQQIAATGSGLADVVIKASYDTNCLNIKTCNKPNWIQDARGNQYDYAYDPVHGGILTSTSPPDPNGYRPQQRNTYVQRYAWIKNSSGAYARAGAPVWLLATTSVCRTGPAAATGAGCAFGPADEVVTTYEFGPDSGPNNLWIRGKSVTAVDGGVTQTLRTCYSFDRYGNRISETSARAGLSNCP